MKELIDQISLDECETLSDAAIAAMFARYEAVFGAEEKPSKDKEPTAEQLSAFDYLLKSGVNPYCDFGVFGPYGHRMLKKVRLTGTKINADGELSKIEINGPASYQLWCASWAIFQNCAIMTDSIDLGKLVGYKEKMDAIYTEHGDKVWACSIKPTLGQGTSTPTDCVEKASPITTRNGKKP